MPRSPRPAALSRRACLLALLAPTAAAALAGDEAALREAFQQYQQAWNRRDAAALERLLADDAEWVSLYAHSRTGRGPVLGYTATAMPLYGVDFQVSRIRLEPDGARATLLFRGRIFEYPVRDGRPTRVYARDLLASRWRLEAGRWQLEYLNENANESAAWAAQAGLR